ncbi:MAG: hypothetical protein ACRYHA_20285 [Janthinobacterium lividum]
MDESDAAERAGMLPGYQPALIAQRVDIARRRYGLDRARRPLRTDCFAVPAALAAARAHPQGRLF